MMVSILVLKRPSSVDYSLCVFCRKSVVPLREASDHGLSTVRTAAYSRRKIRDLKNIDLIDRLENELDSTPTVTLRCANVLHSFHGQQ